ncbi:MAG TPA: hypothetical protein PLZ53_07040, partial [Candidatus Hydrogenedentes bacterium]|nr:hypothetical protein [Candidatus Hydrogenedentota bacterium]
MDESLWPARNVAEYAYCPRLFYFMQIEGVFIPSYDTEEGKSVHGRVDKPSAAPQPVPSEEEEDTERPVAVRSLTLTSKALSLTATLDLAEIQGTTAVPVEYRKGRPRHFFRRPAKPEEEQPEETLSQEPEPWPTDRVQVG